MYVWGLIMAYILSVPIVPADMIQAHVLGAGFANSGLGLVQGKAQSTSTTEIPGFKTANPHEASLDNGSIGDATLQAAQTNEAATYIVANSRERQLFKIDSDTDPMFVNANKAALSPEQTMGEVVMETAGDSEDGDGYELVFCEDGGDEYLQKCSKHLEIKIKITPPTSVFIGYTYPNRWYSSSSGQYRCGAGCCPDGTGCKRPQYSTTPRKVEVISEEWIDGCAVLEAQSDIGVCRYKEVDEGSPETRTIVGEVLEIPNAQSTPNTEPISRDSWQKNYTYACFKKVAGNCQALSAKGCVQISSECSEHIGDVCVSWRQTYRCPKAKKRQLRYKTNGAKSLFCLTGDCMNNDYEANGEMNEALSQLMVLNEAQKDIRSDGQNFKIFKGQARRCRKAWNGARDCCGSGNRWAVTWKMAPGCDVQEQELGDWRAKRRCVEVGTYCAKKLPIIGCIEKKTTFCCFGNKLSRLIQEQGRAQLGISWGDPESPDCRGLTSEELSRIDMGKMNLSELYEDVQKNFKPQTQDHIARGLELERIRENMQHLSPQGKKSRMLKKQRLEAQLEEVKKQKYQLDQFFEEQNQGFEQEMLKVKAQGELKATIDALNYIDPIDRGDGWILGWNYPTLAPRLKPHLEGLSFSDQIRVLDRLIANPSSANIARVFTNYNNGRYAPMTHETLKKGLEDYKQALVYYQEKCGEEIHQIPEFDAIFKQEQAIKAKQEDLKLEYQRQEKILDEKAKELLASMPEEKRHSL